ncbi:hypothetical protein MKZ38_005854 [Zalerion maritima]|uniref:Uncharacterized protein n=1 Tax=Zalerion maritima TaxID=339359 RepID=A0AAD5RK85_9PEZI|nr:hypothetical protein MKZ38_005854 [Zalerion maritima]
MLFTSRSLKGFANQGGKRFSTDIRTRLTERSNDGRPLFMLSHRVMQHPENPELIQHFPWILILWRPPWADWNKRGGAFLWANALIKELEDVDTCVQLPLEQSPAAFQFVPKHSPTRPGKRCGIQGLTSFTELLGQYGTYDNRGARSACMHSHQFADEENRPPHSPSLLSHLLVVRLQCAASRTLGAPVEQADCFLEPHFDLFRPRPPPPPPNIDKGHSSENQPLLFGSYTRPPVRPVGNACLPSDAEAAPHRRDLPPPSDRGARPREQNKGRPFPPSRRLGSPMSLPSPGISIRARLPCDPSDSVSLSSARGGGDDAGFAAGLSCYEEGRMLWFWLEASFAGGDPNRSKLHMYDAMGFALRPFCHLLFIGRSDEVNVAHSLGNPLFRLYVGAMG